MVSALLQPRIDSTRNQIALLKAQLSTLAKADVEATRGIKALSSAIQRFAEAAPDELPTLRQTILDLFDSNLNDQQSVTFETEPRSSLAFQTREFGTAGVSAEVLRRSPEKSIPAQAGTLLTGDYCEIDPDAHWRTATPDGSSWELMTPLCCQRKDCPAESLQGQAVEFACLIGHLHLCEGVLLEAPAGHRYEGLDDRLLPAKLVPIEAPTLQARIAIDKAMGDEIEESEKYIDLVQVNDRVAYQRRSDGVIIAVYAGGTNKGKLKNWGDWLTRTHTVTHGYELREAKRLTTKWELKLTPMTLQQIERLASCDFNKDPRSVYPDAPKRQAEPAPRAIEIENIGINDLVRSVTVKTWQYKVKEINADGYFICERLNTNPVITQTLHPGSIELVSKGDVVDQSSAKLVEHLEAQVQAIAPGIIDETDIPRDVVLRSTNDDLLIEYTVWMWALVRNQGVPEKQLKQIGRLVEGMDGIEAYRPRAGICQVFSRTLHAIDHLILCSGQKPADILERIDHNQRLQEQKPEALVGVAATDIDDDF